MKTTSNFEVNDLLSPLSARGIEKQLARLPGELGVQVNSMAGSATVAYDPERVDAQRIHQAIEQCGDHCRGESLPRHLCLPHDEATGAAGHTSARTHARARAGAPAVPHGPPHGAAGAADAAPMDAMAHEMGHGHGMDVQLSTEVAAIAMSGSSALVAVNALLLKRTRLNGIRRMSPALPSMRMGAAPASAPHAG